MSDKITGLICAIPQERVDLKAALDHQETVDIGGLDFDRGRLDGHDVVLAEAGIGKVNTAVVATLLASRFGVDLLAFSGVAGGLDPTLHIGDLVIADRAVQHDCGVIEDDKLEPYQAGHVPFFNPTDQLGYPIDATLLTKVKARLADLTFPPLAAEAGGEGGEAQIAYGPILAGDQYIHCETTRERLHRTFEAKAVAMEGGAMAQVAERFGLPWLEIRALSDLAGADSRFDFSRFVDAVAERSATVIRRILPVL
ncbi:MAG: 5'-methylthioadenosine/adenosylhomocysteine nucleosidase [Alphaproteobacteria bacterium]|nr:5'-methylthioadenosine/adenosylhomocysteine nucleosidase [Alphaproteobacteria bacterium]